jgi:DNA polymerase-3 subunit delta
MKFDQIIAQLKEENYAQVYFLMGEEPWYADYIADYIAANALKEEEKAFNQTIFYGRDVNAVDLIHAARRYPMMAPRQVIIVKEAQNIKNLEPLESYLNAPAPTTILVINYRYKSIDKRTKVWKLLDKNDTFITLETKKLYDNQMGPWINNYLKTKDLNIEQKANLMLVDHLGTKLSNVVKALDKLKVAVGSQAKTITPQHIEEYIGISKDFNNFELQNAIVKGDALKANQIARIFSQNPKEYPIQMTIGVLFAFYSKLMLFIATKDKSQQNIATVLGIPPFFVKDYQAAANRFSWNKCRQVISLLREYDMRSKGFNNNSATPGDLLQELIFKIMH